MELETDRITQQGIRAWIQRGSKQTARKIVDVLLEDGRMPIEKIGKVTGVSLESIIKLDLERREGTPNCKAVAGRLSAEEISEATGLSLEKVKQ